MSLSSPFDDWLGTNYRPSIDDVSRIADYLQGPRNDLAAVSDAVVEAQNTLRALLLQQLNLQKHIASHEALIHPIRRLPDEILQEVFLHALPKTHRPVLSNLSPPILLTHVCRHWRVLAHATPALWTALHIPIPRGRSRRTHLLVTNAREGGVKYWLELAKGAPLSLSLYWPPSLLNAFDTEMRFPTLVLSQSKALRELELDLPDDLLASFIEAPASDFPLLERIVLRFPCPPDQPSRGLGIADAFLWAAPKLNRVVWESVDEDWFRLPLKWERMKEIDIAGDPMIPQSIFSPSDARTLLQATPLIETLRVELSKYPQPRAPPGFGRPEGETVSSRGTTGTTEGKIDPEPQKNPLTLNHLTTLDLTDIYIDAESGVGFLANLYLPALTTLVYRCFGLSPFLPSAPSPDASPPPTSHRASVPSEQDSARQRLPRRPPTHPLLEFLRAQDRVGVKTWKISATAIPRDAFIECLRLMPCLEKLHVMDTRPFLAISPESEAPYRSLSPGSDRDDAELGDSGEELVGPEPGAGCAHGPQEYVSMEDRYHDYLNSSGRGRRVNRYGRTQSLRATEIAPDDDLLKSFVPSTFWWRERWAAVDQREHDFTASFECEPDVAMETSPRMDQKGKGRSRSPVGDEGLGDTDIEMEMAQEELEVVGQVTQGVEGSPLTDDDDTEMPFTLVGPGDDHPPFSPPTTHTLARLAGWASSPSSPFLPPAADTSVSPLVRRISVPIPVDTSDLEAEEAEVLCPRLRIARFDRARFSLEALETFVRARRALSAGLAETFSVPNVVGQSSRQGLGALWEHGLRDSTRMKLRESLNRGRHRRAGTAFGDDSAYEDDGEVSGDGESTTFFTARSSPGSTLSGVMPLPENEDDQEESGITSMKLGDSGVGTASGRTTVRATPPPMDVLHTGSMMGPCGFPTLRTIEDVAGTPKIATSTLCGHSVGAVSVAPIQRVFAGLLYDQPESDVPESPSFGESPSTSLANSRLSATLYEEYGDLRLSLRFASPAHNSTYGAPGLGEVPPDGSAPAPPAGVGVGGNGGGPRKVRNDPRDGIRGWRGREGVRYEEVADWGDVEWMV